MPLEYEKARVTTVRLRVIDMAGKIVRHARHLNLKLNRWHYRRFQRALLNIEQLLPAAPS